jgi:HAE1 family hydrophobic/amphiphilic exporter-1
MKRAARRFRPILLTAIAFLLGCVPLLTNSASNAVSRYRAPVIGGLLATSLISMLLIPALVDIVESHSAQRGKKKGRYATKSVPAGLGGGVV